MISEWMKLAACRTPDGRLHVLFMPPEGSIGEFRESKADRYVRERAALRFCDDCPVRRECEDWANRFDTRYGIWGGETAETLRLRRQLFGVRRGGDRDG